LVTRRRYRPRGRVVEGTQVAGPHREPDRQGRRHRDGTLGLLDRVATGQAATCWVTQAGTTLYTSNAGSGTLSAFRDNGSGGLTHVGETATDAGTVDASASADGRFLYADTGAAGIVDEFAVRAGGSLTKIGSVAVPGDSGGQGITVS
jgi:6-phosphogluconolactonase (cycloisomerase 2 family)